jgi:hypothetical protein
MAFSALIFGRVHNKQICWWRKIGTGLGLARFVQIARRRPQRMSENQLLRAIEQRLFDPGTLDYAITKIERTGGVGTGSLTLYCFV